MPDSALDIVQRASPYREGLRGYIDRGLAMLTGDRQKAEVLTDIADLTPMGNFTAANELPGAVRDAVQHPGWQSALAAGLTAASMAPFAGGIRRGAQTFSKEAGRTAHIGVGPRSVGWDTTRALDAADLESLKVDPLKIKQITGMERDAGGNMLQEISDHLMAYDKDALDEVMKYAENTGITQAEIDNKGLEVPLAHLVKHPALYEKYPQLKDYTAYLGPVGSGAGGGFDAHKKRITLNHETWNNHDPSDTLGGRKVALHELSHGVNAIEGWNTRGANVGEMQSIKNLGRNAPDALEYQLAKEHIKSQYPADYWKKRPWQELDAEIDKFLTNAGRPIMGQAPRMQANAYKLNALEQHAKNYEKFKDMDAFDMYQHEGGEVKARNDASRIDWTPEQRANSLLSDTESVNNGKKWVSHADQLIRGRDF